MMLTTNVTTITEVTTMFMIIAMFMMMMVLPPAQRLRRSSRFLSLTLLAQALTCVCHWSESTLGPQPLSPILLHYMWLQCAD